MFVSCTNSWEQMFDFRRHMRFPPRLIWSLQGRQQNPSLGVNPIDNAERFPHDNIVGGHSCDECRLSNEPSVCHKLLFTLWLLEQACSQTKEWQVCQFGPNTGISGRFESILLTVLQPLPVPPPRDYRRPSKEFRPCAAAPSFCSSAQKILQRAFSHVLPYRMITRQFLREDSPTQTSLQLLRQSFVIRKIVCTPQQQFLAAWIHVECIPNPHGQEMVLVLQDRPVSSMSSTWDSYSASFQKFWYHEHNPCLRWTSRHSQCGTLSHPGPKGTFSKLTPTRGLQVSVRTNFAQEEARDLQCLTMTVATSVVDDVSIYLDLGVSSILTWV